MNVDVIAGVTVGNEVRFGARVGVWSDIGVIVAVVVVSVVGIEFKSDKRLFNMSTTF